MTAGGQSAVNYAYDNANRPTQIVQGSAIVSFGYDTANRRAALTPPNGIVRSYGYDNAGCPTLRGISERWEVFRS
jgi:YD repeat-containing protein